MDEERVERRGGEKDVGEVVEREGVMKRMKVQEESVREEEEFCVMSDLSSSKEEVSVGVKVRLRRESDPEMTEKREIFRAASCVVEKRSVRLVKERDALLLERVNKHSLCALETHSTSFAAPLGPPVIVSVLEPVNIREEFSAA